MSLKKPSRNGTVIELTAKAMKLLAEEKGITFSIIIEPDLPEIMINTESIERALKNLLSNAIKYSHKNGRVKVRAEIDRTGEYVQVSIEDNGIGIPDEHLGKIFDRFYRIETRCIQLKAQDSGCIL